MLEWIKNHSKETFLGLAVFLVFLLFLINQSIKTMIDETTPSRNEVKQVNRQVQTVGNQSVSLPSQDLPQENPSAVKKPKDSQGQASEEIIYEPSIKNNVLVQ